VASPKSNKRARKRRSGAAAPRAVASPRREERRERQAQAAAELRRARPGAREGERPPSLFGGLPVSEIGIFIGSIGLIVGFLEGGGPVLIVSVVIVALAVIEFTAREHFTGYRSHTTLLAAIPALAVGTAAALLAGQRLLLPICGLPVFGALFWLLRGRFAAVRQARVTRRSAP
jgi:hypothetical protein